MTTSCSDGIWAEGDPYECYVGRWSRLIAEQFLHWLSMPPGLRWLDVGCGTGALTAAIADHAKPLSVTAVEPSAGFRARAGERLGGRATLLAGSASQIGLEDATIGVAVSGLVLNFVPNLSDALAEINRTVQPGGIIAAYVWDYAQGMELMRYFWDSAVSLQPQARSLDEALRFPICEPSALAAAFASAGIADVVADSISVATPFRNFDEYWWPFLGGQGPAPAYVCELDAPSRDKLRDRIRERLPTAHDGSIALNAKAWVVRGRRAA